MIKSVRTRSGRFFVSCSYSHAFFHYSVPVTLEKRLKIKVAGNSFQALSRRGAVTDRYNHSLLSDVIKLTIHLCPRQW